MSTRDELIGSLIDTINKQFKDMKVAYFLMVQTQHPQM